MLLGLAGAVAAGLYAYRTWEAQRVALPQPKSAAQAAHEQQACIDACEQQQIVAATSEEAMRACRKRCLGQAASQRPYQPIRSITRAPADHSLGAQPERPIRVSAPK